MIKLTWNKSFVFINPEHITSMYSCEDNGVTAPTGSTIVRLLDQKWFAVKESPEEICRMIREERIKR